MTNRDKISAIKDISCLLSDDKKTRAADMAQTQYPFVPVKRLSRNYSKHKAMKVFWRDGFIDRYSGHRLVFPGALYLLSHLMPKQFPFHQNWRMDFCHMMYWELFPVLDHIDPLARGGPRDIENLVCTSALRNQAKLNWTLKELGWEKHPKGKWQDWDGLLGWFSDYTSEHPAVLENRIIQNWHKASVTQRADVSNATQSRYGGRT